MNIYWKLYLWFVILAVLAGIFMNYHLVGPALTTALFSMRHGIASIKYSRPD